MLGWGIFATIWLMAIQASSGMQNSHSVLVTNVFSMAKISVLASVVPTAIKKALIQNCAACLSDKVFIRVIKAVG